MTKMSKSRIVAAIDIGSTKIATLVSQVATDPVTGETSVNVVGAASSESRGIKKGQIVDIEEAVEATISSVEAAERMAGYNLESVFVALGGAHIHSQNSHGVVAVSDPNGEINQNDVDRAIEAASAVSLPTSREVIHVLPREFIVPMPISRQRERMSRPSSRERCSLFAFSGKSQKRPVWGAFACVTISLWMRSSHSSPRWFRSSCSSSLLLSTFSSGSCHPSCTSSKASEIAGA